MSIFSESISKSLTNFENEYQEAIKDRNRYLSALQEIENNPPETPAEYADILSIVRRALNGSN